MIEKRKVLSPLRKFENSVARVIKTLFPNFGNYDSIIYAKVIKVNFNGGKVDEYNKRYSVELQPLNKDFSENKNYEKIIDVPFDIQIFGGSGVVYSVPKKGAIVRMGFMYNEPSFPYVAGVTAEGLELPKGSEDEFRIETSDGTILQLKGKKINIKTDKFNTDLETTINLFLEHTHLGNTGAPTSATSGSVPPIIDANFKTGDL